MAGCCGYSCIKYVMFGYLGLYLLFAAANMGAGIWAMTDYTIKTLNLDTISDAVFYWSRIELALGCTAILFGILALVGTIKEVKWLLFVFLGFVFLVFIILVAMGTILFIAKDTMRGFLDDSLHSAVQQYYEEDKSKNTVTIIQGEWNCCGASKGIEDFKEAPPGSEQPCPKEHHETPCTDKVHQFFLRNINVIAGVPLGIAAIPLAGVLLSALLIWTMRKNAIR